jgi:phage shock protein PspC (stress-responsive transcriptional regulator)
MAEETRKRLLRSRDDRVLAGVAGGIGNYLDVDPTLVRVGFVIAALFGGLGIAAYLILAVVTPNDDGSGAPAEGRPSVWMVILAVLAVLILLPGPFWGPWNWGIGWWWGGSLWLLLLGGGAVWAFVALRGRDRRAPEVGASEREGAEREGDESDGPEAPTAPTQRMDEATGDPPARRSGASPAVRVIAISLLVLCALCFAGAVTAASAWATATGHAEIVAGVVIAIGAGLVVAAFVGEPRWRWLIVPALVLALPAGAVAAADVRFDGGLGEREYHPATVAAIDEEGYSLGVGQLTVDLREIPWRRGESVEVETDMGVGETIVSVPANVCVESDAHVRLGEVYVRGQRSGGVDPEVVEDPPQADAPRLMLDSEVDVGALRVSDRPPEELRDDHDGFDDDDERAAERAEAQRACER